MSYYMIVTSSFGMLLMTSPNLSEATWQQMYREDTVSTSVLNNLGQSFLLGFLLSLELYFSTQILSA